MRRLITAAVLIALMLISSRIAAEPRADVLPPLPDSIPSALGWVAVHRVPNLTCNGVEAFGCYDPQQRTLSIRDSINRAVAWQSLRHEELHVIIFDAGLNIPPQTTDLLADAVGAARVREMLVK